MEKKNRPLRLDLPAAVVYLDDIEHLVELFREVCEHVEIESDEYKFGGLEDLKIMKSSSLRSITLRSTNPWITVEIGPEKIHVYAGDSTPALRGLVACVSDHFKGRASFIQRGFLNYLLSSILVVTLIPSALHHGKQPDPSWLILAGLGLVAILGLGWIWWSISGIGRRHVVRLESRAHATSFLVRKKDDLLLALVSGAIGALLGVIGSLVTNKLTK